MTRMRVDMRGGCQMGAYRCYILDGDDHIVQAHILDCETDAQAESAAKGLLGYDLYHHSAEVWNAARRVAKVDRNIALRLRAARRVERGTRAH